MICNYQYVLKVPVETDTKGAEKYAVTTLETDFENSDNSDEITVYGVDKDSDYVKAGLLTEILFLYPRVYWKNSD